MKVKPLSILALGAIFALAAARPASADPLFTGSTWDDISSCHSSTAYPYDELQACTRALDDLSAQVETANNQVDRQHIGLEMANIGLIEGYLYGILGMDGADGLFSSARNLLQTIAGNAVSADIAERANTMLQTMNDQGI